MNRKQELEDDLRLASLTKKVIYLEGKSDVDVFFALLGVVTPSRGLHHGVLVKGLNENEGSGSTAVKALLNVAAKERYKGIFGIIDGDGLNHRELAQNFDKPHAGPLFRWKAYCIENLLAKTGWPNPWGNSIDWELELSKYSVYVALARLHQELQSALRTLKLARIPQPNQNEPLRTVPEVLAAFQADEHLLQGYQVAQRFRDEVSIFEAAVRSDMDEVHASLNGKWLVEHMAPTVTGSPIEQCRTEWIAHAISVGGLPEVREWWERVTGSPP